MKTPKELSRIIAANVRKRRKERKLSMQDLAEKSGVSYGSVKRFESSGAAGKRQSRRNGLRTG